MASAILLIFLTLLGGARNSNPLNRIYFLEANTANIPGAPAVSRWTFWQLCSVRDGKNDCGSSHPDFPFDPPSHRNFGTTTNVPPEFIGYVYCRQSDIFSPYLTNHRTNHYFLTSRFMFPFILIGLFFATLSLFTGLVAMCTRIGSYISGFLSWLALTFITITTCLMTAVFVQGRSAFNRNGQSSSLGVKAFAFMWTATACLFLSCLLYCLGGAVGRKEGGYSGREQRRRGFFSSQRSNSVRSQSAANKKETSSYA
ncbi:hypothetical protein N7474_009336 [Penicillium riverlandense]|uniref:uncharacterized protein n=1 Tax=Penicillium riverlandense TaxID=1903569 RepID=UPI002548E7CC|nr:uncharacterized protein N7474_009336 [Penicillium riverlandense]KAJ5808067.1 hypothetical protein N7474_009336 [Penicillium riverlandense]